MDWQAIAGLPTGVAIAAIAMFFYNQTTVKYLDERKEWLISLAAERKEWNDVMERLTDRYDMRLAAAIEAMTAIRDQMHALRGDIQKVFVSLEARLATLESRTRGTPGDHRND